MLDACFITYIGGHRTRSLILKKEFEQQGRTTYMVSYGSLIPKSKLYIVDVPEHYIKTALTGKDFLKAKVVVMGVYTDDADLVWHPLGKAEGDVPTLCGIQYILVDSNILQYRNARKTYDLFIACGSSDITNAIPKILGRLDLDKKLKVCVVDPLNRDFSNCEVYSNLPHNKFLEKLGQSSRAILGWGQSCFEAYCLDVPTLAIPQKTDHFIEASRLKVSYSFADSVPKELKNIVFDNYDIPMTGAEKTYLKIKDMFYA
jgi:hypothetical protein